MTDYTKEELLYRELFFATLNRGGNDSREHMDAMKNCAELVQNVLKSDARQEFKYDFINLFKDQASKLYEIHDNWSHSLKSRFEKSITGFKP